MVKLSGMNRLLDHRFAEGLEIPITKQCEYEIQKAWSRTKAAEMRHKYRRWQRLQMGFAELKLAEVVEELAGAKFNHSERNVPTPYEYVYNHHRDREERGTWRSQNTIYSFRIRKLIAWPPWSYRAQWEVWHMKIGDLPIEPPPAMMLRLLECRAVNLFNSYSAMLNERKVVLLGALWELPPGFGNTYTTSGSMHNYFLGEWSLP